MIRTILTAKSTDIHLSIPKEYIGKQVEVLLYTTEEVNEEKKSSNNVAFLRGSLNLTKEQYIDFQKYSNDTRNEWNKDI